MSSVLMFRAIDMERLADFKSIGGGPLGWRSIVLSAVTAIDVTHTVTVFCYRRCQVLYCVSDTASHGSRQAQWVYCVLGALIRTCCSCSLRERILIPGPRRIPFLTYSASDGRIPKYVSAHAAPRRGLVRCVYPSRAPSCSTSILHDSGAYVMLFGLAIWTTYQHNSIASAWMRVPLLLM
jgi:hypothetical protein